MCRLVRAFGTPAQLLWISDSGAGTLPGAPTANLHAATKGYVDGAIAAAAPTTEQVLAATAVAAVGAIGSHVFAWHVTDAGLNPGDTVAGSDLREVLSPNCLLRRGVVWFPFCVVRETNMSRFDPSEAGWRMIEPLLPGADGARIGRPRLPEGVGFDENGEPTTDAAAVARGGVAPFGGHKGCALALVVQMLGLLAGSYLPRERTSDYAGFFVVVDPRMMLGDGEFEEHLTLFLGELKGTPRRGDVAEILLPSERALRQRELQREANFVDVEEPLHRELAEWASGRRERVIQPCE